MSAGTTALARVEHDDGVDVLQLQDDYAWLGRELARVTGPGVNAVRAAERKLMLELERLVQDRRRQSAEALRGEPVVAAFGTER